MASDGKPMLADIPWDHKPRTLEGGEIALPAAFAVVVKKLEDYDLQKNTIDCKLTIILRVKITGLTERRDLLVKHLKEDLRMRINESEVNLIEDLNAVTREAESKDWVMGDDADLICYTIRLDTQAQTNFDCIYKFPFDTTIA